MVPLQVADVSRWVTMHLTLFILEALICAGPMLLGMSQVVFEGVPTYPDASRAWAITDKYKVPCPTPYYPALPCAACT